MRKRSVLIGALPLLGAGLAAILMLGAPQHYAPDTRSAPFQEFGRWCATFDEVHFHVEKPLKGIPGIISQLYLVHAFGDGRITADQAGRAYRLFWDGKRLTHHMPHYLMPEPERMPDLEPFFRDVWSECRAGFANSIWTPVDRDDPARPPFPKSRQAARLAMPFTWAQGLEIVVAVPFSDRPSVPQTEPMPRAIYVRRAGAPEWETPVQIRNWVLTPTVPVLPIDDRPIARMREVPMQEARVAEVLADPVASEMYTLSPDGCGCFEKVVIADATP